MGKPVPAVSAGRWLVCDWWGDGGRVVVGVYSAYWKALPPEATQQPTAAVQSPGSQGFIPSRLREPSLWQTALLNEPSPLERDLPTMLLQCCGNAMTLVRLCSDIVTTFCDSWAVIRTEHSC